MGDPPPSGEDVKFQNCPHCDQHLSGPDVMEGKEISCPTCGMKLMLSLPLTDSAPAMNLINNHPTDGVGKQHAGRNKDDCSIIYEAKSAIYKAWPRRTWILLSITILVISPLVSFWTKTIITYVPISPDTPPPDGFIQIILMPVRGWPIPYTQPGSLHIVLMRFIGNTTLWCLGIQCLVVLLLAWTTLVFLQQTRVGFWITALPLLAYFGFCVGYTLEHDPIFLNGEIWVLASLLGFTFISIAQVIGTCDVWLAMYRNLILAMTFFLGIGVGGDVAHNRLGRNFEDITFCIVLSGIFGLGSMFAVAVANFIRKRLFRHLDFNVRLISNKIFYYFVLSALVALSLTATGLFLNSNARGELYTTINDRTQWTWHVFWLLSTALIAALTMCFGVRLAVRVVRSETQKW